MTSSIMGTKVPRVVFPPCSEETRLPHFPLYLVEGDQPIVVSHIRFPSEQEAAAKAQEILQVSAANITNNEEGRAIAQWLTQLAAAPKNTPSTQEAEKTYELTQWQMDVLLADVTYWIARYAYKRSGDFEPSESDEGKSIGASDLYHLLEELRQQHQAQES